MIRLVRPDVDLLDAAIAGDRPLAGALGYDAVAGWATFRQALRPTREGLAERRGDRAWGPRFFVTGDPPEPSPPRGRGEVSRMTNDDALFGYRLQLFDLAARTSVSALPRDGRAPLDP